MMFPTNILRRFSKDEEGVVSVMLAVMAIPVLSSVAMIGSISQQNLDLANINKWAQEACQRINSPYYENLSLPSKAEGANKVLETRTKGNDRYSYNISTDGGTVTVDIQDHGVAITSALNSATSVTLECYQAASHPGSSENQGEQIVFFEDFEAVSVLSAKGYGNTGSDTGYGTTSYTDYPYFIFPEYPNWSLVDGPGVELQYVTEEDNQVAEFDSTNDLMYGSACAETCGPHTQISREIDLTVGTYRLSFQYTTNHNRNPIARMIVPSNTDRINYSLYRPYAGPGEPPINYRMFEGQIQKDPKNPGWSEVTRTFTIDTNGAYQIHFKAGGTEDYMGGLIDDIKIVRLN